MGQRSVFDVENRLESVRLIRKFQVTPASVQDSQVLDDFIEPDNGDSGAWA